MHSFERISLIIQNVHIKYCQRDLNYLSSLFFNHEITFKSFSKKKLSVLRAPFINKKSQLKFTKNIYSFTFSFYTATNIRFLNNKVSFFNLFLHSFVFLRIPFKGCFYTRRSFYF